MFVPGTGHRGIVENKRVGIPVLTELSVSWERLPNPYQKARKNETN